MQQQLSFTIKELLGFRAWRHEEAARTVVLACTHRRLPRALPAKKRHHSPSSHASKSQLTERSDGERAAPGPKSVRGSIRRPKAEDVLALEVRKRHLEALYRVDLASPQALPGVVVLLVGLVLAIRIPDLPLEIIMVLLLEVLDALPIAPLSVGIDVHLDDTVTDGLLDIRHIRPRPAVEDELDRLLILGGILAKLPHNVLLRPVEDLRLELNVTRRVDPVHVAEGGSDREHGADGGELLVDLVDLLGSGVELRLVHILVVDAVLLAARDAELHLEHHAHGGHALQVVLADLDVLLDGLLGEVNHVRREKGLPVRLEVALRGREEAVHPREQLLRAVIRVEDHGHAVLLGKGADVEGARHGAGDGGGVVSVVKALAGIELGAARRELDDDGRIVLARRLETRVDARRRHAVDRGNSVAICLGVLEEVNEGLPRHNARVYRVGEVGELLEDGREPHLRGEGLHAGGGEAAPGRDGRPPLRQLACCSALAKPEEAG
mmetsp:Transcript_56879/g.139601  ORF Transcript_56879/g.139601 Transcript_56879/m.139601 type:complete len:494 (-) Transcript_56879:105-1586(-)